MNIFTNESNHGNIEYKLNFKKMTNNKFQKYSSQLKYRVLEGYGKAIYIIGISDDGRIVGLDKSEVEKTINLLHYICNNIHCKIDFILKCSFKNKIFLIFSIISNFNIDKLEFII